MSKALKVLAVLTTLAVLTLITHNTAKAQTPACSGIVYEIVPIDPNNPDLTTQRPLAGANVQVGTTAGVKNYTTGSNGYWTTDNQIVEGVLVYIEATGPSHEEERKYPNDFNSNTCAGAYGNSSISFSLVHSATTNPNDCNEIGEACCYSENTQTGTSTYYCDPNSGLACSSFNSNGTCISTSDSVTAPPHPTAIPSTSISGPYTCNIQTGEPGSGEGINTAIGCIPVNNINSLVGFFLRWALGIGAGAAFLLIIVAAFQIITSSGNPDQINAGKQLITSAISGLLLLIFAVTLLQLIGIQILRLPGLV